MGPFTVSSTELIPEIYLDTSHRHEPFLLVFLHEIDLNTIKMVGVAVCPKTLCPHSNVAGPLVPKLIVPCDTMSLD